MEYYYLVKVSMISEYNQIESRAMWKGMHLDQNQNFAVEIITFLLE